MPRSKSNAVAVHTSSPSAEKLELASDSFVGRWNTLVSTTNWEKGRIIQQWREA